jgi:uncharacterized membrane protein
MNQSARPVRSSITARDVALALALGALAGVRAAVPNALLGRAAAQRPRLSPSSFLATRIGAHVLGLAGLLELVGDKLPGVPDRTETSPRLARIGSGGLAAAALGRPRLGSMALLALVGGATAAVSTRASHRLRRRAISRWGLSNTSSGLLEDVLVLGAATLLLPLLRRARAPEPFAGLPALVTSAAQSFVSGAR